MLKNPKKRYSQSVTVKKRSNFTPDNLFLETLIEGDFTMSDIMIRSETWRCDLRCGLKISRFCLSNSLNRSKPLTNLLIYRFKTRSRELSNHFCSVCNVMLSVIYLTVIDSSSIPSSCVISTTTNRCLKYRCNDFFYEKSYILHFCKTTEV